MSTPSNINNLLIFKNSQGTEARGTLLKLSRTTIVFEVYNPYSIVQLSEVLQELKIFRGEQPIYEGKAVVSNLMNTGLMLVVSATLVDSWSDLTESLKSPARLRDEVNNFVTQWDSAHKLDSNYQIAVNELRVFLSELSRWVEQVDTELNGNADSEQKLETIFFHELATPLVSRLSQLFLSFEKQAEKIDDSVIEVHKTYAQTDLQPLMLRSPFFYRSYTKPLGYAGDFEMVNMMTRQNGREGPTTYSQIINTYFYNIGPTRAHRNRITILTNYLKKMAENSNGPIHILNIGCGPALELQEFIHSFSKPDICSFKLIDFNKETIDYTRHILNTAAENENKNTKIEFVQRSVHTLLKQANENLEGEETNKYDFVYCAGLFDYLSDRVCARLLNLFYQWTKPGGLVLSTNVHPSNPSRWTMEHVIDWYLIHRDEKQMLDIASKQGEHSVYLDLTGYNVFLETHKPL